MKKLLIALYCILLISAVSAGMLWAAAEPSSEITGGADSSATVTSQDVSSAVSDAQSGSSTASVGDTESGDASDDAESDASSAGSQSGESADVSSAQSASAASSSRAPTSSSRTASTVSKTPPPYQDEGYIYDTDDEDYVQVTSDSLSQPADADGDGVDDAEEEKMDNSVSGSITRIIWIPIVFAVASAAALVTINVLYRKKYGKLIPKKKKEKAKNKKANLYIPRD